MSPLLKTLGIDQMSVPDRIFLVQDIWDSIADANEQIPLTETQRHEIARRLKAYEANPENVIPWEVVKANAEARLRK